MRVAAIDCGTNAIRLLVADVDPPGEALPGAPGVRDIVRVMETVRLGEGVDASGRLSDAALDRTFAACERYAALIEQHGIVGSGALRFIATSASRDAENRDEFVRGVRERLGVTPEVMTGEEEARLSFSGAMCGLGDHARPVVVVDIGGGSTEFVLGDREPQAACSVDIGCVRLTERHLAGDPPTEAQIAATIADIEAAIDLAASTVPLGQAATLVGLAGSVTTVAALALGLPAYDAAAIHRSVIGPVAVHDVTERLLAMTRAERARLPVMHPGRVDVIAGGALVLDRIVTRLGMPVVASESDILDGLALAIAQGM